MSIVNRSWQRSSYMGLLIVGMIVLALLIYLAYSLIYPERF